MTDIELTNVETELCKDLHDRFAIFVYYDVCISTIKLNKIVELSF
jgi:hypothetical protein